MTSEIQSVGAGFLGSAIHCFRGQKSLSERAAAQLDDDQLHQALDANTNSVAINMKHIAGNMLSRWTDFLTSDGEKDWRHRDAEFVDDFASREELMAYWEQGWARLLTTIEALTADDLTGTIMIRGQPLSVIEAIHRQIDHYGYHVGQIVLISRILAGDNWVTLSIGRGESGEYNRRAWGTV